MKTFFTISLLLILNHLSAQVSANAGPDREICFLDTLVITGSGLNVNDTGSYQWTDAASGTVVSSTAFLSLKIMSTASKSYALKVTKNSNGNTFYAYDTVHISVNPLPVLNYNGIAPLCFNNGCLQLTLNKTVTLSNGTSDSIRFFQKKNPSWISGGPAGVKSYEYCFSKFISNSQVPKPGFRDTICYDYTDAKGCYNSMCRPMKINPNPVVEINDGIFCPQEIALDNLVKKPFSKVGGIQTFRVLAAPVGIDPNTILKTVSSSPEQTYLLAGQPGDTSTTGEYEIEYCFKDATTGCQSCDTSRVKVIRSPKIVFSKLPDLCVNGPFFTLDSLASDAITGKRFPNGSWSTVEYGGSRDMSNASVKNRILNAVKSQKLFDPSLGSGSYLLKLEDKASGCSTSDSVTLLVNGLPNILINIPDTVCANAAPFTLENITPAGSVGTWSGKGVSNGKFDPSAYPTDPKLVSAKVNYTYTHPTTGCTSSDSADIWVQNPPRFRIQATRQGGKMFMMDFTLVDQINFEPSSASYFWTFNGTTSTLPNPVGIYYPESGTYTAYVRVTDNGCETLDSVVFKLSVLSIDDIRSSVAIYPNPAGQQLNISMPFDSRIMLYDLNGKLLTEKDHDSSAITRLDLSGWEKGVYLLSVQNENQILWQKLIIE
jgi:hypothetical protein